MKNKTTRLIALVFCVSVSRGSDLDIETCLKGEFCPASTSIPGAGVLKCQMTSGGRAQYKVTISWTSPVKKSVIISGNHLSGSSASDDRVFPRGSILKSGESLSSIMANTTMASELDDPTGTAGLRVTFLVQGDDEHLYVCDSTRPESNAAIAKAISEVPDRFLNDSLGKVVPLGQINTTCGQIRDQLALLANAFNESSKLLLVPGISSQLLQRTKQNIAVSRQSYSSVFAEAHDGGCLKKEGAW